MIARTLLATLRAAEIGTRAKVDALASFVATSPKLPRDWSALPDSIVDSLFIGLIDSVREQPSHQVALSLVVQSFTDERLCAVARRHSTLLTTRYPATEPFLSQRLVELLNGIWHAPEEFATKLDALASVSRLLPAGYDQRVAAWRQLQRFVRDNAPKAADNPRGLKRLSRCKVVDSTAFGVEFARISREAFLGDDHGDSEAHRLRKAQAVAMIVDGLGGAHLLPPNFSVGCAEYYRSRQWPRTAAPAHVQPVPPAIPSRPVVESSPDNLIALRQTWFVVGFALLITAVVLLLVFVGRDNEPVLSTNGKKRDVQTSEPKKTPALPLPKANGGKNTTADSTQKNNIAPPPTVPLPAPSGIAPAAADAAQVAGANSQDLPRGVFQEPIDAAPADNAKMAPGDKFANPAIQRALRRGIDPSAQAVVPDVGVYVEPPLVTIEPRAASEFVLAGNVSEAHQIHIHGTNALIDPDSRNGLAFRQEVSIDIRPNKNWTEVMLFAIVGPPGANYASAVKRGEYKIGGFYVDGKRLVCRVMWSRLGEFPAEIQRRLSLCVVELRPLSAHPSRFISLIKPLKRHKLNRPTSHTTSEEDEFLLLESIKEFRPDRDKPPIDAYENVFLGERGRLLNGDQEVISFGREAAIQPPVKTQLLEELVNGLPDCQLRVTSQRIVKSERNESDDRVVMKLLLLVSNQQHKLAQRCDETLRRLDELLKDLDAILTKPADDAGKRDQEAAWKRLSEAVEMPSQQNRPIIKVAAEKKAETWRTMIESLNDALENAEPDPLKLQGVRELINWVEADVYRLVEGNEGQQIRVLVTGGGGR